MLLLKKINLILLILIGWTLVWILYNYVVRPRYENPLLDDPLTRFRIELPHWMKCHIVSVSSREENNRCDQENLDGWSIGHFAIYFTIGMFVPNAYLLVLGVSILTELWEYVYGWRARWFLDPLVNVLGYACGTLVGQRATIQGLDTVKVTIGLSVLLLVIIQANHPNLVYKSKMR